MSASQPNAQTHQLPPPIPSPQGQAKVGIIMGSQSDWETMQNAAQMLADFGVPFECEVVSAHRTPDRLFDYAKTAKARGLSVIIAGAGGAAHLPGIVRLRRICLYLVCLSSPPS